MLFTTQLASIMAIQHQVIKQIKKKTGLRQRDWEILCACSILSLARYPFTASKLNECLGSSYFLPCLYDSINVLLDNAYISIVFPGKPFQAELYDLTWKGRDLVKEYTNEIQRLSEEQEYNITGKYSRIW